MVGCNAPALELYGLVDFATVRAQCSKSECTLPPIEKPRSLPLDVYYSNEMGAAFNTLWTEYRFTAYRCRNCSPMYQYRHHSTARAGPSSAKSNIRDDSHKIQKDKDILRPPAHFQE